MNLKKRAEKVFDQMSFMTCEKEQDKALIESALREVRREADEHWQKILADRDAMHAEQIQAIEAQRMRDVANARREVWKKAANLFEADRTDLDISHSGAAAAIRALAEKDVTK